MSNENIINNFKKLINLKKKELIKAKNNDDKILVNQLNFKIRNFNNVIKIIQNYNQPIKKSDQLKDIKGIGSGTLNRIDEILKTTTLKELEDFTTDLKSNSLEIEKLESITGIGEVKANDLLKKK